MPPNRPFRKGADQPPWPDDPGKARTTSMGCSYAGNESQTIDCEAYLENLLNSMLNGYAIFKRVYGKANSACGVISTIAVLAIMVGTIVSAISRWIRIPIIGIDELNGLLTGMAIYLGLATAQAAKANISVTFLVQKLSVRNAWLVDLFMLAIATALFAHVTYIYWEEAYRAFVEGDFLVGIIEWPVWPLALTLVVGVAMLVIQLVIDFVERARELVTAIRSTQPLVKR